MDRAALDDIILGAATVPDLVTAERVEVDGSADAVHQLLSLLDTFDFWFNIVTP